MRYFITDEKTVARTCVIGYIVGEFLAGFAGAGSLFICLVEAVLIYIVVKESNIPYVLATYIAEAALFLLCIKRF